MITESPLKSADICPCICFADQAQFQPIQYLTGIAHSMNLHNGVQIFTETHASDIERLKTEDGYGY
jgi:hypothetical protein